MLNNYFLSVLFAMAVVAGYAQAPDLPTYNHYYVEPYFYNPAFMAAKDRAELNLIYRQQWAGLEGAPVFSQMSFIYPISRKLATGVNIYNNKRGLLTTTSAQASLSYAVGLGDEAFLSFGMSGGVGRTSINLDEAGNTNDPALSRALDKSFFAEGQAGFNLQIRRLSIGFSIPQLFRQNTISSESFQKIAFNAFNTTISSVSYKFDLGPDFRLQPLLLYRTMQYNTSRKAEFEGYGTLYYKDFLWVGGLYRPDYGASAYLGLQINKTFQFGYSYEFGTKQVAQLTNNTHEFRLGIKIGKQRVNRHKEIVSRPEEPQEPEVNEPVESEKEVIVKEEPKPEPEKEEVKVVTPVEIQEEKKQEPVEPKEIVVVPDSKSITPVPVHEDVQVLPAQVNDNPDELKKGTYLIVGVFSDSQNAIKYSTQMLYAGYKTNIGYNSVKKLHYVYILTENDLEVAKKQRDNLRKITRFQFKDTWILIVE